MRPEELNDKLIFILFLRKRGERREKEQGVRKMAFLIAKAQPSMNWKNFVRQVVMTINSDNCTKKRSGLLNRPSQEGGFWMHLVKVESLFLSEF